MVTEHYAGVFPVWLAPVQATVLPVGSDQVDYARQVVTELRKSGLRVEVDARDEKIGRKIREAEMAKVPAMLVVGGREAESGQVSVRRHGGEDQGAMTIEAVKSRLLDENRPHE
jgi:threonyl-tRNA synthetase